MANPTTNYGFVLPTSSDLVTDLPADFDVALQGVDTRLKALNPETTLGDISYASATANTNTRRAIGTTGQVLTVAGGVPTWATPATSALTLISTTTFSGVSSQSVNNCFSSTYDNYKIIITYTSFSGATNAQVRMRLRASGTDNTNNYSTANNYYSGAGFVDTSYENTNGFLTGYASANSSEGGSLNVIDIMDPFAATETVMSGIGSIFLSNLGRATAQRYAGTSFVQSSFDGFTLIPASDTISGKVRVYGYSN